MSFQRYASKEYMAVFRRKVLGMPVQPVLLSDHALAVLKDVRPLATYTENYQCTVQHLLKL